MKCCLLMQGERQSLATDRPPNLRTEDAVDRKVDGREVSHALPGL